MSWWRRRAPRGLRDVGPIRVEFLPRGRVRLLDTVYWPAVPGAPALAIRHGIESDGGSVPPPWWLVVGHPYSASMLAQYLAHDAELQRGVPPWTAWRYLAARCWWRGNGVVRIALVLAGIAAWILSAPVRRWLAPLVTRARAMQ